MEPRSLSLPPAPEPAALAPEEPRRAPLGSGARRSLVALAVVLILGGTGAIVRVPLHSLGPGPARDVLGLIQVHGTETHPSRGQLLLTTATVSGSPLSLLEVLYVWIDPNLTTTNRRHVVPPGFTDEEQSAQNTFDMEASKLSAELAAFDALGQPAVRIRGARVVSVIRGSPADGVLQPRDVIIAVDGADVASEAEARDAIRAVDVGDAVHITLRRDGSERTVEVGTRASPDDPTLPVVGAFLSQAWRLPHDVQIDTSEIGGPSGGLVFALAIVDALTPDDLTRGHIIAATGTIQRGEDNVARIGVIGAVGEKVRAARSVGATVFMLPAVEVEEARRLVGDDMIVIGVETLTGAIEALRSLPQRPAS